MKLEAGKFYRTRDGRKVGPIRPSAAHAAYAFPWTDGWDTWTSDGRWSSQTCAQSDLIAEWTDAPQPDADGWIKWGGGECPVPPETLVKVRFRDDCETSLTALGVGLIGWRHSGMHRANDVVAYRVVSPKPAEPSGPVVWTETTVRTPRIVPGTYGVVVVVVRVPQGHNSQVLIDLWKANPTAPELRAAISTLSLIAEALEASPTNGGEP